MESIESLESAESRVSKKSRESDESASLKKPESLGVGRIRPVSGRPFNEWHVSRDRALRGAR